MGFEGFSHNFQTNQDVSNLHAPGSSSKLHASACRAQVRFDSGEVKLLDSLLRQELLNYSGM